MSQYCIVLLAAYAVSLFAIAPVSAQSVNSESSLDDELVGGETPQAEDSITDPMEQDSPLQSSTGRSSDSDKSKPEENSTLAEIEKIEVSFEGAPAGFAEKAKLISLLASGARRPATLAAISRAAKNDLPNIKAGLQSYGYYEAEIDYELQSKGDREKSVIYKITPGRLYRVRTYRLVYSDAIEGLPRPDSPEALGVTFDNKADGAAVMAAQQTLLAALWNAGYPKARAVGRRAIADTETAQADIEFRFESGPRARFGTAEITGAERSKLSFLQKLKTWNEGDLFEQSKLISYRDRLIATNLFASVDVAPGAPRSEEVSELELVSEPTKPSKLTAASGEGKITVEDNDVNNVQTDAEANNQTNSEQLPGIAPILVTLEERKQSTIGAGLSFSTTEGPGGRLFHEYRNVFGAGETLRTEISASEVQQSIGTRLNKPLPLLPGSAFATLAFTNETPDAFTAQTINAAVGASKTWLDGRLETQAGLGFETSNIETDDGNERTFFVSGPLVAVWNTEEDPLALTRGERVSLTLTPFAGTDTFIQTEFNARGRQQFGPNDRYTIAARTRLGATFATTLDDLPLTRRFFAGGGASVRGFDFQAVGPLDENANPIGGLSVIEGAIEARAKVHGPIQVATFIDAGSISDTSLPKFSDDFFVGVGAGLRYLSPIGPLRLDIAFPTETRETDRQWQLAISLGQPF
ncbi:MAG: BamA/TamA family outer membrane protein [Pseudomonadota bacterium]